jgi:NAD(P)-dependent dehydrogenase (short-subunit alcohol dehydrogenase family)
LNIMINNAAVMNTPEEHIKENNYELQFATNHLAHFLLFYLLKDLLLAASTPDFHSRVVNVSSIGHRMSPIRFDDINFEKGGYNAWVACK